MHDMTFSFLSDLDLVKIYLNLIRPSPPNLLSF